MKKIIFISALIVVSKIVLGQNTFSECYDTLRWHQTHDRNFSPNPYTKWQGCIKGKEMPHLSFTTINGEKIETKDLKGKIMVINLWFTTCHPCIAELPALNKLVEEYKGKDVVFLGISTDTKEMLDADFFPKYKFDFKIIANGRDVVRGIGNTGFPTTYIIDANGKVVEVWIGGSTDKKAETEAYLKMKPVIDELLKAG